MVEPRSQDVLEEGLHLDSTAGDAEMAELRSLIAADAQVADADILSIHCGVVELTDRYDVDELDNADVLVVRLRAAHLAGGRGYGRGRDREPVEQELNGRAGRG